MQLTVTGDVLAWWGAALATLLAIIRVIEYVRDKPRLKVWGEHKWDWHTSEPHWRPEILLTAVNVGKRPVNVVEARFELSGGRHAPAVPPPDWQGTLPRKLDEGDALWYPADPQVLSVAEHTSGSKAGRVVFVDAAGREFHGEVRDDRRSRGSDR